MGRRGLSLGLVLMLVALAFTVVSVLVGTGLFHIYYANLSYDESTARALAEAGISKALANVATASTPLEANYGAPGGPGYDSLITVSPSWAPEGSQGLVCFNATLSQHQGIAWSTNNLNGSTAPAGWNSETVPVHSLHLVGTGLCRHSRACVEAFYYAPPFPYSIGSAGPVVSNGYLVVGGLAQGKILNLQAAPNQNDLIPGHMASNSDADESVKLGPQTYIAGNLRSAGGLDLDPSVTVTGSATPYAGTTSLPELTPSSYDPQLTRQTYQPVGSDLTSPKLDGIYRSNGDLTVHGDLNLKGGVLYVPGNLDIVGGGITGKGAVITGGNLSVDKAAAFSANNQVALLAEGDMTLKGTGTDRSFVQGVMYSRGSVVTSDITLMGSLIKAGDDSATVNVSNTHLVEVPEYTQLSVQGSTPSTSTPRPPSSNTNAYLDWTNDAALARQTPYFIAKIGFYAPLDARSFYNPATDTYDASSLTINDITVKFVLTPHGHPTQTQTLTGSAGFSQAGGPHWHTVIDQTGKTPQQLAQQVVDKEIAAVAKYNTQYQALKNGGGGGGGGPSANTMFSLDLNEFLTLGDQLRLILWRPVAI